MSAGEEIKLAFEELSAVKMTLNVMLTKRYVSRTELAGAVDQLRATTSRLEALVGPAARGEG